MKDKTIFVFFGLALILIVSAFVTINVSLSKPDDSIKGWDIYLYPADVETDYIINNKNFTYKLNLSEEVTHQDMVVNIVNDGLIDGKITDISNTNLDDIILFKSQDKIYYLKDFIDINIKYYIGNTTNNVEEGKNVSIGDVISSRTKNIIEINIDIKDNLSEEEKNVLRNHPINEELNLNISFEE